MKRTLGPIMVGIGGLFAISSLLSCPKGISDLGTATAEGWTAYAYGRLTGMILIPIAAFLLIRYGIKFSKSKAE